MAPAEGLEKLDPREHHFCISGPVGGFNLFVRHLSPVRSARRTKRVLFVHGMSFPSALSIAHRFDGRSWRDELCHTGFDVWGLDFCGFGCSDRYTEMSQPAESNPPLGHAVPRISLIAHSVGTIGNAL